MTTLELLDRIVGEYETLQNLQDGDTSFLYDMSMEEALQETKSQIIVLAKRIVKQGKDW
jgi:hypothetical protein